MDHCYGNIKNATTIVPYPHFGKSDQLAILLSATHITRQKTSPVTVRIVRMRTDSPPAALQGCLEATDNIDKYVDTAITSTDALPSASVPGLFVYSPIKSPNLMQRFTQKIRKWNTAYTSGDIMEYRHRYELKKKSIKASIRTKKTSTT